MAYILPETTLFAHIYMGCGWHVMVEETFFLTSLFLFWPFHVMGKFSFLFFQNARLILNFYRPFYWLKMGAKRSLAYDLSYEACNLLWALWTPRTISAIGLDQEMCHGFNNCKSWTFHSNFQWWSWDAKFVQSQSEDSLKKPSQLWSLLILE